MQSESLSGWASRVADLQPPNVQNVRQRCTRLFTKVFAVHGLVFCFVMQHRLEVDQCQGSQVSSLSKQLEKSVEKVGSLVIFWSFVEGKK